MTEQAIEQQQTSGDKATIPRIWRHYNVFKKVNIYVYFNISFNLRDSVPYVKHHTTIYWKQLMWIKMI